MYSCLFSFFFRSIQVIMLFKFALITMLATAFISEASANSCPRWMKLNKSPVCFGARDSQFGAFAYSQNILVSSFMLVHRSGTMTCNKRHYSYWGCYPNHASLNVVLTDHQNKLLAPAATNHDGWYSQVTPPHLLPSCSVLPRSPAVSTPTPSSACGTVKIYVATQRATTAAKLAQMFMVCWSKLRSTNLEH